MFKFEHPEHLYALLVLPVFIVFFILMRYARKRALEQFGDTSLMQYLMPQVSNDKKYQGK